MRSLFVPLRLATDARDLELSTELDPRIDRVCLLSVFTESDDDALAQVARQAAYSAMGESASAIEQHLRDNPDTDGIVVGDETRLRQIVTNLARYLFNTASSILF
jgi:osomolarity two-component system, sensor histidine kinase SLN1